MTLLVRRRALLAFVGLTVLLVLLLAAAAYGALRNEGERSPEDVRSDAEWILYGAIVAVVLIIAAATVFVARAYRFSALEKLTAANRMSGFSPESALERMGEVGQRITALYRQISELSERRRRKIGALSLLVEEIIGRVQAPILVTDSRGVIVHASGTLLERSAIPRASLIGADVAAVLGAEESAVRVRDVARTRERAEIEHKGERVELHPVTDATGEVSYIVVTVPRSLLEEMRRAGEQALPAEVRAAPTILQRLFGRRRRAR